MSGNHTPTPWEIYECPIVDADAAKEELAYQVDHTEPVGPVLYLLNAGGKCPALTGCGPSSKANAELIVTAVNSYASSQAEIERLRTALEFYADPNRYQGPNQRAEENERHRIGGYRIDVTRDGGEIARAALSGGKP